MLTAVLVAVVAMAAAVEAGWYLNRGLCHARLDNWKEATKDYSHALEMDPTQPTGYRWAFRQGRRTFRF